MHIIKHKKSTSTLQEQVSQHPTSSIEQNTWRINPGNQGFWKRLYAFWGASAFTPSYLPTPLRRPLAGYMLALLLPFLTVLGIFYLKGIAPELSFVSAPVVLGILIVSLGWGALPGLLATLWGTFLLGFLVLPPHISLALEQIEFFYSMFMFTLVGLGITLLSTQVQRAHHQTIKARADAEAARANLSRILMQALVPIIVLSKDEQRIELVNPNAWQAFGQRPILGKTLQEALPEYASQVAPVIQQVRTNGKEHSIVEHRVLVDQHNDGSLVEQYYNVAYQPMLASDGNVDGVIIIGSDVTEQVQARHKVEHLLAELDNFISVVAHELRTPITAAKMCVQVSERKVQRVLGSQPQVEEKSDLLSLLRKNLQRIEHQLELQNRLVHDLLDASRVRADRMELRPRLYNLVESLQDCVEDQRTLHPDRKIQLIMPEKAEIRIKADPERVQQVINNYLTNALKYSDTDKPVAVEVVLKSNAVSVSVRDKGPGLNEEQQKRIWERFYRAPGIHVRNGSGVSLGLGLFICRSIIERQGGRVGVTSTPGLGSSFWFTLPLSNS